MDLNLTDQVAFVAGSSRGIGKAIAEKFLLEGCRTVITGRSEGDLQTAQAELTQRFGTSRLMALQGDLTDLGAIRHILMQVESQWGNIDCAVANIGTGRGQTGWDISDTQWTELFRMNLWSSIRLISEILTAMVRRQRGSVVFISSITGLESTAAPLPYSAAKAALLSYAKNVARQVGPYHVRVNSVAPGNILFPGGSWDRRKTENPEKVASYIAAEVPLGRFGNPEEIADCVVFLSSDRANFITGSCIVADGGQTRSL
jgi:3-oxoacyl-[acyl-carrier protein] reductase